MRLTADFPHIYSAARAWLEGDNPYDVQTLQMIYDRTGVREVQVNWFLNPPGALPMLSPLGLVSFPTANVAWLLVSLGLIGVIVVQTAWWARVHPREPGFLLLAAAILALSPFHTSVAQGQLSIVVTVFVLLALRADHEDSPWRAGLLLAMAASLKPQMVFAFGLYYLVTGQWRVCLAAVAGVAVLTLAGVGRMELAGVGWWNAWQEAFAATSSTVNNPRLVEDSRYLILSLPMLLYLWTDSPVVVWTVTITLLSGVGALTVWIGGRRPRGFRLLLVYSLLAELALLGAYHRIYDATVLVLPLSIAALLWRKGQARLAGIGLLCMLPMVISGAAALIIVTQQGYVPQGVADSMFWRGVVMPHVVWLLLILLAWTAVVGMLVRGELLENPWK